jgi:hypothetical protein
MSSAKHLRGGARALRGSGIHDAQRILVDQQLDLGFQYITGSIDWQEKAEKHSCSTYRKTTQVFSGRSATGLYPDGAFVYASFVREIAHRPDKWLLREMSDRQRSRADNGHGSH